MTSVKFKEIETENGDILMVRVHNEDNTTDNIAVLHDGQADVKAVWYGVNTNLTFSEIISISPYMENYKSGLWSYLYYEASKKMKTKANEAETPKKKREYTIQAHLLADLANLMKRTK